MKTKFRWITFLLLLMMVLLPITPVYAQGPGPGSGRVTFGTNITITSDEPFNGDLVLFGGNVTVEKDAQLNGDLVVIGGNIVSDGSLNGDVVVIGGQIKLEETAVVSGDVVLVGGQIQQAEGAEINGNVVNNIAPQIDIPNGRVPPNVPSVPDVPNVPDVPMPYVRVDTNPLWTATGVFFRAIIIAMLAMLIVVFLQPQMERVSETIVRQPLMSGGLGLAAAVGGPIVIVIASVIMVLTLILIPVAALVIFLGGVLLALAWLFGVIALGFEVGERITRSINQTWAPVFTAGLGTFLVVLIVGALGEIPCVGWVVPTLIGLVAIGAVAITRFGLRPMPVTTTSVYSPPTNADDVPPAS